VPADADAVAAAETDGREAPADADVPGDDARRRRGRDRQRRRESEPSEETASPMATAEPLDAPAFVPAAEPQRVVAEAAAAPAPAPASPPPVQPFVLPADELLAVAEGAGLEWVNSDAEKIRAAQDAMAREPAPMRVPRERKAAPVIDEGPLVLVETVKDLSQMKLPFEAGRNPPANAAPTNL
jgi:ribonuclease E